MITTKHLLSLCFLFLWAFPLSAQPSEWEFAPYKDHPTELNNSGNELDWRWNTSSIPTAPPPPPTPVPIDGGLGFLLVAGGAYSLRKLKQNQKK